MFLCYALDYCSLFDNQFYLRYKFLLKIHSFHVQPIFHMCAFAINRKVSFRGEGQGRGKKTTVYEVLFLLPTALTQRLMYIIQTAFFFILGYDILVNLYLSGTIVHC